MLFDSSLRRELAGSFSATLVTLVTVVVTITLIRVVGDASRNIFSPADVLVIMAFTVLSDAPTILSLSMFIAVTAVITRMYRDSEMVIWLGTGKNPVGLVKPVLLFAWPVLFTILVLATLVLPWSYGRIEDLRDKFEKRGEIARFEPGSSATHSPSGRARSPRALSERSAIRSPTTWQRLRQRPRRRSAAAGPMAAMRSFQRGQRATHSA